MRHRLSPLFESKEPPAAQAIAGLRWIDFELRPHSHIQSHSHGELHLCIVQSGQFEEREGKRYHRCSVDIARLSRPGVSHELYTEKDASSGKMIELLPGWGYNDPRFLKEDMSNVYLSLSDDRALIHDIVTNLEKSEIISLKPFLLVRQLLANHAFAEYQRPSWYDEVKAYLDDNYLEQSLSIRLAIETGLHRTHFARQFFRAFGCSVGEYTRVQRLDHAIYLIRNSALPLSAIAHECMFSDQSHLTRSFKTYVGLTPGMYKQLSSATQSTA